MASRGCTLESTVGPMNTSAHQLSDVMGFVRLFFLLRHTTVFFFSFFVFVMGERQSISKTDSHMRKVAD
jgi:hypothetical protein